MAYGVGQNAASSSGAAFARLGDGEPGKFPHEAHQTFSGVMISKGTLRWRIEPLSF
jgi:hypothetical protein